MAGWRGALLRHFTTARVALAEVPGAGYSAPQTQPYNQVPYNAAARIRELSGGYSFTPEPYPGEPVTERTEFLWKVFFKDPSEWWDNRNRKRVSTEPDFEKKGTKERLWLDDKTPAWVEGELEAWKKRKEEARRPTHGYGSHLYPSTATASEEGNSSESNASTSETPSDVDSTGCKEFKPEASPEAIKRVNKALDEIMVRIREKEKKAVEEKAAAADKPAEETDSTAEASASSEKKPGSLIRRYPRHNRKILEQEGEEGKLENSAEYHSEKLAIAYGLLKTPPGTTIRIFKNLRVCVDCHEFTKAVTRVTGREIIARDANRFHHFKDGKCSCNDYW